MVDDTEYTCFWSAGDYSQMPDDKLCKLYMDAERELGKMLAHGAWHVDIYEQSALVQSLYTEVEKRGINPCYGRENKS